MNLTNFILSMNLNHSLNVFDKCCELVGREATLKLMSHLQKGFPSTQRGERGAGEKPAPSSV